MEPEPARVKHECMMDAGNEGKAKRKKRGDVTRNAAPERRGASRRPALCNNR
ncbi:hypothetical protein SAMN05445871_1355 [Paraburkholderia caballeronis]|uniref:Uncharacterized protein n=1 Tax=Paraburkholderia caballeronis TaxID=416943 RepID=A0A1H7MQY4_9BURK|nr:hypothetical protein C7403_104337 [Paraburkholderia caballeronis]PXX02010.1 hypothetical protein C7407_104337 [Paraburkholderia caballeronis]RAK01167.1 hypothetical protein C7409_104337 [Paraburkholderia caballeronis]SEB93956.1 hypothetical protein SAMN05445871_1355 [Paraburkholderia caballeronis]SEL13652.1 hypothetical protein SAMN05192542_105132 [Paraburkholderia caballeronis]